MKQLGYSVDCGPILFDLLASELAETAVEISSASAKRLYNAFRDGYQGQHTSSNLKPLHFLEPIKPCNDSSSCDELVISRVMLDEKNGLCPRTGAQLRLIDLDAEQKKQLQDGLVYLAGTAYEERFGGKNSKAKKELRQFGATLE